MNLQNSKNQVFNPTIFPFVSIENIRIPPRNYLISIPPIGIGTSEVESLSSYISRLAREYYVSPNELVKICVEKYFNSSFYLKEMGYNINNCKSINSSGKIAETAASAIGQAANRQDIIYTTLLPWRAVLSQKQMKIKRAWCPSCFESDLANKTPIYERLLWKIDIVESCSIHNQKLIVICPHCESSQSNFSTYSFPGFCSHCKTWLGEEENSLVKKANDSDVWLSSEIGKVLAASQKARTDVQARIVFANSIRSIMDKAPYFTYLYLRNKTGLATSTIKRLAFAEIALSFRVLMKICQSFNCSAVDILLGNKFNILEKKMMN